eukprot:TRINITY_DN3128_c0_g1_i1.p1 TRINITY_DN3128_c0_g1~~TRINITY_DN3128_c0_g1_i1.p1  ORF type:complete len:215 (-),score=49.01 TRINITY_DN3128_c0_g1_i1:53-619(-)
MNPLTIVYCPVCGLPSEYCDFGPSPDKCEAHHKENSSKVSNTTSTSSDSKISLQKTEENLAELTLTDKEEKKPSAKPKNDEVKLLPGGKVKKKEEPMIYVSTVQRNKRKYVTVVQGLESFGIKQKDATKIFANKFSCGAAVVKGPDNVEKIDVQGDVKDEIMELIVAQWKVPAGSVIGLEDGGKKNRK